MTRDTSGRTSEVVSPPHVVVGVDGSDPALNAVDWAAAEARRRGIGLRLVACFSVPFYGEPGLIGTYAIESQVGAIKREHEGFIRTAVDRALAVSPGLAIESVVTLGSPAVTLPNSVESDGVLVVGSVGRTGRLAELLGSVATAVVHHASVPVVVVPSKYSRKDKSMSKIVVGTDGSAPALEAMQWAYDEARLAKADLVVVHGWEYPYQDGSSAGSSVRERMKQDAAAELDRAVSSILTRSAADGVTVRTALVEKLPAQALIDESADADLVVVGSRGRGGLTSMLLGSVSRAVVQHATCPIAVIRHRSR